MYYYHLKFYDEDRAKIEILEGLAYGESYSKVMDSIMKYYGEDWVFEIFLKPLNDEYVIEYDNFIKEFSPCITANKEEEK